MNTRRLGKTNLQVSEIGFGAEWLERHTNEVGIRLIQYACSKGVNILDCWMPDPKSRDIIGEGIKPNRDKWFIQGHIGSTYKDGQYYRTRDMKYVRPAFEDLLTRLQTDYIDIYFYHRDDPRIPVEEMVETMQDFIREGKIRYFAVSNWTAERQKAAMEYCRKMGYRGPIADQALLNLGAKYMNPLADDTMLACKGDLYEYHKNELDTLMMPFMGNASGFFHIFAAKGEEGVKNSPYATPKNLELARRVVEMSKKYDCAITNVVLGYFSSEAFPCVPLYGPFNEESIKEAARTFDIKFDKNDYNI